MRNLTDKCLFVGQILPEPHWRLPAHLHREYSEIIVVMAGEIETQIDGQRVRGKAGDVLHYPRGHRHAEAAIGSRSLETIFVGYAPGDAERQAHWPRMHHDARGRMRMIVQWMFETRSLWPRAPDAITNHLLHLLLHEYAAADARRENPMIERVRQHVRDHLAEPLSLEALASVACMSRFHFAREFRKHLGVSPMRFVRDTRIDAARSLLLTTRLPHRQIARHVGFPDEHSLARIFRRETGQCPSGLRRR